MAPLVASVSVLCPNDRGTHRETFRSTHTVRAHRIGCVAVKFVGHLRDQVESLVAH